MVKRTLVFLHRWLGVLLCVVFLIWFVSGIGMMYWTFPTVTAADRLERAPALDPATVVLSPAEAAERIGLGQLPRQVRLNTFDGRPVYRFGGGRGSARIVYADTGEEQGEISRFMLRRIASAWTGRPAHEAQVERLREVDQWTVQANVRSELPLWKYSWPNGEEVYVSERTGEVVQYTTTASRIGAYLGPIPHWLYFTPLRKHGPEWSRLVIWSSGVGTIVAILGIVIGGWMYSPSKRYRYDGAPSRIPYRGQKRWHMVLGLVFGVGAVTWAFSGMLSMDPFPSRTGGPGRPAGPSINQALRGRVDMAAFAAKHPREALRQLDGMQVKELELMSFDGEPIYLATLAGGRTQIVPVRGEPRDEFDHKRIVDVVRTAAPDPQVVEARVIDEYDWYYIDRHGRRPLPVILVLMHDPEGSRHYIDPKTARVVGSYSSRNWVNRWLYTGLHSLNFPFLYKHRPLWDFVVMTFMLGGTALCVTSVVLAWRVVNKKMTALVPGRATPAPPRLQEDVA
jgi:hypothetical protein